MRPTNEREVVSVINTLRDNGYPLDLIFEKILKRLKTLFHINNNNKENKNKSNDHYNAQDDTNNKKIIVIPYINKLSEMVAATIDKSQYIIGYRVLNNLLLTNNNVVYKISCMDCDASYVGQTKRQLKTRIKEHYNNIRSTSSNPSVITEHILQHSHTFDWDNVKILDTENNYFKRSISEMIHIKEQSHGLNAQKDTELLDNAYFNILDSLSKF